MRRLTQIAGKVLSPVFGKMELPFTKMEETWMETDLGGQIQLNLASLSLRYLVGIQGESRVGDRDLDCGGMIDSHQK